MRLREIERGGHIPPDVLADLQDPRFDTRQGDLFHDIPTLEPNLPPGYAQVGRIGAYVVLHKTAKNPSIPDEDLYLLLDRGTVIGWVVTLPTNSQNVDYPHALRGLHYNLHGKGRQIAGVQIDRAYAGQNLAMRLYEWMLQNVCDFIVSDLTHTSGGEAIWRKLRNSRRFDVMVYDPDRGISRRRWSGKDWEQVYNKWHLIPWVTLRGKAEQIMDPDE